VNNICILTSFKEDNRKSMNIYSDNISLSTENFKIFKFTPKFISFLPHKIQLFIWLNKYVYYPLQIMNLKYDLYHIIDHTYSYLIPFLPKNKVIVTVHDIIPILAYNKRIPGLSYPNKPVLFNLSLSFLKHTKYIITVSENTKSDILKYFKLGSSDIRVIYNGIDDEFISFSLEEKFAIRKKFNLQNNDTFNILITGSLAYKNHDLSFKIIEKLENLTSISVQLIILKNKGTDLFVNLDNYKLKKNIIILENLSKSRLIELYNSVDCLLFPSFYEGFGIPVIESMACGTPVVLSDIQILKEIANDCALFGESNDIYSYVKSILLLIEDKDYYNYISNSGILNSKKFTLNKQIQMTHALYSEALIN
jgi:glycosyltransferase involved in cell wall biosynthesis